MGDELRFTILGCGSSGGVPRIGGNWGLCDPNNLKNRRRRCSLLVQRFGSGGVTNLLIDTSPDMREQLLDTNIEKLDAVIYTHDHADHVHGLDDLRMVVLNMKRVLPVYANSYTQSKIKERFSYAFSQPKNSPYSPILKMNDLPYELTIQGMGGDISINSFDVMHGRIDARAIRINDVLYTPDISDFYPNITNELVNLKYWIVDCLQYKPHPSHSHVEKTLAWIDAYKPEQAILTNMHIDLDFSTLNAITPDNVCAAYDGMEIRMNL